MGVHLSEFVGDPFYKWNDWWRWGGSSRGDKVDATRLFVVKVSSGLVFVGEVLWVVVWVRRDVWWQAEFFLVG